MPIVLIFFFVTTLQNPAAGFPISDTQEPVYWLMNEATKRCESQSVHINPTGVWYKEQEECQEALRLRNSSQNAKNTSQTLDAASLLNLVPQYVWYLKRDIFDSANHVEVNRCLRISQDKLEDEEIAVYSSKEDCLAAYKLVWRRGFEISGAFVCVESLAEDKTQDNETSSSAVSTMIDYEWVDDCLHHSAGYSVLPVDTSQPQTSSQCVHVTHESADAHRIQMYDSERACLAEHLGFYWQVEDNILRAINGMPGEEFTAEMKAAARENCVYSLLPKTSIRPWQSGLAEPTIYRHQLTNGRTLKVFRDKFICQQHGLCWTSNSRKRENPDLEESDCVLADKNLCSLAPIINLPQFECTPFVLPTQYAFSSHTSCLASHKVYWISRVWDSSAQMANCRHEQWPVEFGRCQSSLFETLHDCQTSTNIVYKFVNEPGDLTNCAGLRIRSNISIQSMISASEKGREIFETLEECVLECNLLNSRDDCELSGIM